MEKVFEYLKIAVDIIWRWCYIYHDRRSTTVIATAAVATTVVITGKEIDYGRDQQRRH